MAKKNEKYVWTWRPDLQRLVRELKANQKRKVDGVETDTPLVAEKEERID